jgi:ParB family chromosome partitioning protein
MIPVASVHPNPYQPRSEINTEELHALATSIRKDGLLQPVVVRSRGDRFELVAGERRWRACIEAGLEHIPALVRVADDRQMLEWALVENLQRENLNPVERAKAYERYCREFKLGPEDLGSRLGEDRTTVTNYLRLLDLSDEVLGFVVKGQLSMGHARALLAIAHPTRREKLAHSVVRNGLSVRATESLVKQHRDESSPLEAAPKLVSARDANIRDLENRLSTAVGTKVTIKTGKGKNRGRLAIEYYNLDDFDRIARKLGADISPA